MDASRPDGDTPTIRLFALLETIAAKDRFFSLQSLVEETGLPKPTLHRMLQHLEAAGILQREGDTRQYGTGIRLRRLAERVLLNNTMHGGRRAILRQLVEEVGESCNITALSGSEVLYLERVETAAPLRFYLQPGSRVPVHCSASGKAFAAQLSAVQRRRLLGHAPMLRYTPQTITSLDQLEPALEQVRHDGYALDEEEFLAGLLCIAVIVPAVTGRSNLAVAIQGPTVRFDRDRALAHLPALRRAAQALATLQSDAEAQD